MFNLPWYSWINVLAIPLVWLLVWTGMKLQKVAPWQFKLSLVGHLSIVAIIFLYWNPQITPVLNPATYLLAALAAITALYILLSTVFESIKTSYRTFVLINDSAKTSNNVDLESAANKDTSQARGNQVYVDGVLDIDDDDCVDEQVAMQMVDAFSAAFSPSKSLADTALVQEQVREYSDSELQSDPGICNGALWATSTALLVVLAAPIWMSWSLLKPLTYT